VAEVIFFIAALGALAGAIGVIALRNPFYSVLALVGHLLCLAALFLLLRAEFIAAAQVVVYAGAVMVLYVFVVAYIGGREPELRRGPSLRGISILFVAVVLVELCIAIAGTGLTALGTDGAPFDPTPPADAAVPEVYGSPEYIGRFLLTKFLLPFELASILLLIAAVGAVVLARRRRGVGIEDSDVTGVTSATEFFLPKGTGTMAEGVSGIPDADGEPAGSHPKGTTDPALTAQGHGQSPSQGGGW
jgi:NADH:ubiquinone oxidoreductase subunit 6 (subunit J)